METIPKISEAQKEVWDWKEKASEELNKLSKDERLDYLKKNEAFFADYFKNLKQTSKTSNDILL